MRMVGMMLIGMMLRCAGDADPSPSVGAGDAAVDACARCGGPDCVDLATSLLHCGQCGRACPAGAHANPTCAAGRCDLRCDEGFVDCDGNFNTGCEATLDTVRHCGTCGQSCLAGPHQRAACLAGECVFACVNDAPARRWDDCNGDGVSGSAGNGCESDTRASLDHCGACGRACARTGRDPDAGVACVGGRCVGACRAGQGDCDGDDANGCEADLRSDAHCGACGRACVAEARCRGGACCVPTFGDACDPSGAPCCAGLRCANGRCLLDRGEVCRESAQCASGTCVPQDKGSERCE